MTQELIDRTKRLGINIIFIVDSLHNKPSGWVIGKQVMRNATSVGTNTRATRLAKSTADFINKLIIVEEECEETLFWIGVIEDTGMISTNKMSAMKKEAKEILAITIPSHKTIRIRSNLKDQYDS